MRFAPIVEGYKELSSRAVHFGLQVRNVSTKTTLGALKLLVESEDSVIQVESSIKYFCYDPLIDTKTIETETQIVDLASFVGPDYAESMRNRQILTKRKLALASLIKAWFERRFPCKSLSSSFLLAGFFFLPIELFSGSSREFLAEMLPAAANPSALFGWWSTSVEKAFSDLEDDDADTEAVRWALIPKLHWMSRITLTKSETGEFIVPGVPRLGLPTITTLVGKEALKKAVDEHYASSEKPLQVARFSGMDESSRGFFLLKGWNDRSVPGIRNESWLEKAKWLNRGDSPSDAGVEHLAVYTRKGEEICPLHPKIAPETIPEDLPLESVLRGLWFLPESFENPSKLQSLCNSLVIRGMRQKSKEDFDKMCHEWDECARVAFLNDAEGCSKYFLIAAAHTLQHSLVKKVMSTYIAKRGSKNHAANRVWKCLRKALTSTAVSCASFLIPSIDWVRVMRSPERVVNSIVACVAGALEDATPGAFGEFLSSLPSHAKTLIEDSMLKKHQKRAGSRPRLKSKKQLHLIPSQDAMKCAMRFAKRSDRTALDCIHYIDDAAKARIALEMLSCARDESSGYATLGFDTEWGGGDFRGCAIVQIATPHISFHL